MTGPVEAQIVVAAASLGLGVILLRASLGRLRAHRTASRVAIQRDQHVSARTPSGAMSAVGSLVSPLLHRAGVDLAAANVGMLWAAIAGASILLGLGVAGRAGAVLGCTIGLVAPPMILWALRGRGDELVEKALPDALEAVGRSVRSGASLVQALDEARNAITGPLVSELDLLLKSVRLGNPLSVALDRLVARRPLAVVRLAAAALVFSSEAGGMRSQAIDGLAASLRDRVAVEREIHALASQTRFSAMVIAVLPVGFVLFSGATDPRIAGFLTGTALGRVCLGVGLGLDIVGLLWMRQLTGSGS